MVCGLGPIFPALGAVACEGASLDTSAAKTYRLSAIFRFCLMWTRFASAGQGQGVVWLLVGQEESKSK